MVKVLAQEYLEHLVRLERFHTNHARLSDRHMNHVVRPADRTTKHPEEATLPYLLYPKVQGTGRHRRGTQLPIFRSLLLGGPTHERVFFNKDGSLNVQDGAADTSVAGPVRHAKVMG